MIVGSLCWGCCWINKTVPEVCIFHRHPRGSEAGILEGYYDAPPGWTQIGKNEGAPPSRDGGEGYTGDSLGVGVL